MPKVSILVPDRGSKVELATSVASALRQSELDVEVVIAVSPEADVASIHDVQTTRDSRVTVVSSSSCHSGGLVNSALAAATGDYVILLFPGDELDPWAVAVLLDRAGRGRFDLVQGGFTTETPDGSSVRFRLDAVTARYEGRATPSADPWLLTMGVATWSALYRREFLLRHAIRMPERSEEVAGALTWQVLAFSYAHDAYFVDYPVCVRRSTDRDGTPFGTGEVPTVLSAYEILAEEIQLRPARSAELSEHALLHELITIGRRPDLVPRRRGSSDASLARNFLHTVRRQLALNRGLTSDPTFDDWASEQTRMAFKRLARRGGRRRTPTLRDAGLRSRARRFARFLGRWKLSHSSHGLVGRFLTILLQDNPSRGGASPLPIIPQPLGFVGRNALVVVPWSDENGSTRIIDQLNLALKGLGFTLHVVTYNNAGVNPPRAGWDYSYDLAHAPDFGRLRRSRGSVILDGNEVDDWVGDDLAQFISAANAAWHFDVVVCHYVFFSKVLDLVGSHPTKLLVTHDRFARRNSLFAERGMEESYFFSTTEEEEARGLRRADYVIALQELEADYFQGLLTGSETVVRTLPLLDPPRFLVSTRTVGRLRVGYIGSAYANNRTAILNFFRDVRGSDLSPIEFVIAGKVCRTLRGEVLPAEATLLGDVDDIAAFYRSVDVVFNPDFIESGRKIKVFESLSFGVPVITTQASIAGFEGLPADLNLTSNQEILDRLVAIATSIAVLDAAKAAAREAYLELTAAHRTGPALAQMLGVSDFTE